MYYFYLRKWFIFNLYGGVGTVHTSVCLSAVTDLVNILFVLNYYMYYDYRPIVCVSRQFFCICD